MADGRLRLTGFLRILEASLHIRQVVNRRRFRTGRQTKSRTQSKLPMNLQLSADSTGLPTKVCWPSAVRCRRYDCVKHTRSSLGTLHDLFAGFEGVRPENLARIEIGHSRDTFDHLDDRLVNLDTLPDDRSRCISDLHDGHLVTGPQTRNDRLWIGSSLLISITFLYDMRSPAAVGRRRWIWCAK